VLAADPPAGSRLTTAALTSLASDAAARALALAVGEAESVCPASVGTDLARRAAALLGGPGFDALAASATVPGRELARRALAWRAGGEDGLKALTESWQPEPVALAEGRAALGANARAWRNRLTDGDRQLRLGSDRRWYPFVRRAGGWDPAGPPDAEPGRLFGVDAGPP
jgi:hypothetical protein